MSYYSLEIRKEYQDAPSARQPLPPFQVNWRINAPELYQPSPELADAVNMALWLWLPLLLTGKSAISNTTKTADNHFLWKCWNGAFALYLFLPSL